MSSFDVWVIRFEPGDSPPAERLQRAFGIDAASAESLEHSVPKIVKHAVPAKAAGEMRLALEAIGAVVECKPAREERAAASPDMPAVFRPPDPDLLPVGRMSAIDPFSPKGDPSAPRISVDDAVPPVPPSRPPRTAPANTESEQPRRIAASLLATSRARQRRKFLQQAVTTMLAGVAVIAIGWFMGNSVFRGDADWIGVCFDGVGVYFIGLGAFDFVTSWRS